MENPVIPSFESISTNGWDTVYAIRFADVNKAIERAKTSPLKFEKTINDDDGDQTAKGNFGTWQLTTGGDGRNVRLNLPIPSSTFEFKEKTDVMNNISAIIEINLDWVGNAVQKELKSAIQNAAVISIDYGSNIITELRKSLFQNLLTKWLEENPQSFIHTFSSVDINDAEDKYAFTWLKPKGKISYAVASNDQNDSVDTSIFAVLCMTSNDDAPETHSVSANAIPAGVNSAFLIRPKAVLTNMFLPNIYLLFDGAKPGDFEVANEGTSVTNNKKVSMGKQDMDGTIVTPEVDSGDFSVTIQGSKIVMHTKMKFDCGPLDSISVLVDHENEYTIGADDTGKFNLNVAGSKTDASAESSTGLLVSGIVAGILGAVAAAAIGGVIGAVITKVGTQIIDEAGTTAMLKGTQMTALPAVRTGGVLATNVTPKVAAQAGGQVAAQAGVDVAKTPVSLATIWASMGAKTYGVVAGTIAGIAVGGIVAAIPSIIVHSSAEDAKDSPTLDVFGKSALSPVTWPSSSKEDYAIHSLELVSSLRLNINRNFNA